MINAQDVVKKLCEMGLTGVQIEYNKDKQQLSYNLNTGAKSGLLFFEDFHVEGRYNHWEQIDPEQDVDSIVKDLYWQFEGCICGRDYFNSEWKEIGVKIGLLEKKATTHTTIEYI